MLTTVKRIRTSLRCFFLPILFLSGLVSHISPMRAQPAGTFTPTGSMTISRSSHTATVLADGATKYLSEPFWDDQD